MAETYTREQIESGEGLFMNERTAVYERPDGLFVTAGVTDKPGVDLALAGYGRPRENRRSEVIWV